MMNKPAVVTCLTIGSGIFAFVALEEYSRELRCKVVPSTNIVTFSDSDKSIEIQFEISSSHAAMLTSVEGDCACVLYVHDPIELKRGETAKIIVTIDTSRFATSTIRRFTFTIIPPPVHAPVATVEFSKFARGNDE